MIKMDDGVIIETFKILDKYDKHPKDLTKKEKKRLKELGITVKK